MRIFRILLVIVVCFGALPCAVANTESKQINGLAVYAEDKPAIMVTQDKPQFVIKLKSNPTTGYVWLLREYNSRLITPVKRVFEAPQDKKLMGASGYELWTFLATPAAFVVPQQVLIRFVYARPWEASDSTTQVVFRVATQGR